MNNNEVLKEFFVWEEKSLTDQNQNLSQNAEQDKCVTITETKTNSTPNDWKDITDPKLREKMRKKDWNKVNQHKISLQRKAYREANKDKIKQSKREHYLRNKQKVMEKVKAWNDVNKERRKLQSKAWREANKDTILLKKKAYREANRDKRNERYRTDVEFKISHNLRCRLREALKRNYKNGSAVKDLGCTISQLKTYLESKFQPGMTWDNYGYYGWHIDHIKPLASFNLTDRKQLLDACHYTNLQPLWATDNLSKNDKLI